MAPDPQTATITHVGGPTRLIEVAGWRILTDPTFDAAGRRYFFGWGTTSRKLADPGLSLDDVGPVDAVLVSHHHHGDNLDDAGRAMLADVPTVVTTRKGAKALGAGDLRFVGLSAWDTTTLEAPGKPTITITATPCRHGPVGSEPITGPVIGFSLRWESQEHGELWVTGDTVLYPALREVPQRLDVGTLVIHLGSVRFRYLSGWLRYTMDAAEGAELIDLVDPHTVIPVHYEGWSHFQQGRDAAEGRLAQAQHAETIHWLDPGETTSVEA